jgi:hypothetical protein
MAAVAVVVLSHRWPVDWPPLQTSSNPGCSVPEFAVVIGDIFPSQLQLVNTFGFDNLAGFSLQRVGTLQFH